ncbi:hypothetical protein HWV62_5221 [Athelia sp. TMB]|nr:hypothetical protein HWV62_5221 [Athelia sp. TMB]
MILVPEHELPAGKAAEAASTKFGEPTLDPPPVYTPGSASNSQPPTGAMSMRATNFLMLDRERQSIKGQYVIDPSIIIPESLLPINSSEGERRNVMLKSTYNPIDVDITLLNPRHPMGKPTTLDLNSTHGSVNLKLRTMPADTPPRTPFHAAVIAKYGSATLWLPRDFQGLVSIYTLYGHVKISQQFQEHVTLRHEADHTQRLFLGDLTALQDGTVRDEVHVMAEHGGVRVRFLDEESTDQRRKGFLSKMFGR